MLGTLKCSVILSLASITTSNRKLVRSRCQAALLNLIPERVKLAARNLQLSLLRTTNLTESQN